MKPKFIIFSRPRSGSRLLQELLDSHPGICCEGELLCPQERYVPTRAMRWLISLRPRPFFEFRRFRARRFVYGFRLMVFHAPGCWSKLRDLQRKGWIVVYLHRQDLFQQALSNVVALDRYRWHRKEGDPADASAYSIDPDRVVSDIRWLRNLQRKEAQRVADIAAVSISYEDDLLSAERWQATADGVCDALGLPPAPVTCDVLKSFDRDYSQVVKNYEDVLCCVRESDCADALDYHLGLAGSA